MKPATCHQKMCCIYKKELIFFTHTTPSNMVTTREARGHCESQG